MIDLINGKVEFNCVTLDSTMTLSKFNELFSGNDSVTQIADNDFVIVNTNLIIGTLKNECIFVRFNEDRIANIVMKFQSNNNEHENIPEFIDMFEPINDNLAVDRTLLNRGQFMKDKEWCMPYGKILQRSYIDNNSIAISFCFNEWLFEFKFDGPYNEFFLSLMNSKIFPVMKLDHGKLFGEFYDNHVEIMYDDFYNYFSATFHNGTYKDLILFKNTFRSKVRVIILNEFANVDPEYELPF